MGAVSKELGHAEQVTDYFARKAREKRRGKWACCLDFLVGGLLVPVFPDARFRNGLDAKKNSAFFQKLLIGNFRMCFGGPGMSRFCGGSNGRELISSEGATATQTKKNKLAIGKRTRAAWGDPAGRSKDKVIAYGHQGKLYVLKERVARNALRVCERKWYARDWERWHNHGEMSRIREKSFTTCADKPRSMRQQGTQYIRERCMSCTYTGRHVRCASGITTGHTIQPALYGAILTQGEPQRTLFFSFR